jgi:3-oxoacyl-[acyl-carrier protein] reductase
VLVFDLSGKTALVTGAGQGIGVGIATALAAQGAGVSVNDLSADRAQRTAELLRASGHRAEAVPFDVTDANAVNAGVTEATELMGAIDILVNNAGIPQGMRTVEFRSMPRPEWSRFVDLNLYGSLNCVSAVLEGMCARR